MPGDARAAPRRVRSATADAIEDAYENGVHIDEVNTSLGSKTCRQVTRITGFLRSMDSLLDEMRQCKSVKACIDLALTDAYGEDEQAVAWLTCIEELFGRFKQVRLMGNEVALVGFALRNHDVVAVCQQGKRKARVTLDSIEFPELTTVEQLWLQAWKRFSAANG